MAVLKANSYAGREPRRSDPAELLYKMTHARDANEGRRWKSTHICDVPEREMKNPFFGIFAWADPGL